MSFWGELKRRNVVKVGLAYAIVGWLIVQIADILLPTFEAPAWVMRVIILLIVIGFVISLFVAWAYELTPEGLKQTKEVPPAESITHVTGQRLNYIVTGLLVLAVGFLALDRFVLHDSGMERPAAASDALAASEPFAEPPAPADPRAVDAPPPNAVAVLPFRSLSANEDDAWFARGMHDEIHSRLARIANLDVISRTSVLRYADTDLPIPEIGRQLNVAAVLEGSLLAAGTSIRANFQLIDTINDVPLWVETYNRRVGDIADVIEIQADIAMNVANALEAAYTPAELEMVERLPTDSIAAYRLFLRAMYTGPAAASDPVAEAHRLLDQAIEVDPDFALAHAAKAFLYSQALTNTVMVPSADSAERARLEGLVRRHAERALAIDPEVRFASGALGHLYLFTWRWTEAEQAFERQMATAPSDMLGFVSYIFMRSYLGDHDYAIQIARRLIRLNPDNPTLYALLGFAQAHAGEFEAAVENLRFAIEAAPQEPLLRSWLIQAELARGNEQAALEALELQGELTGPQAQALDTGGVGSAYSYSRLGRRALAAEALARLRARQDDGLPTGSGHWAMAYLAAGDEARALEWLEVAAERARNHEADESFFNLMVLKANSTNDPVLEQPAFVEVRNRIRGD